MGILYKYGPCTGIRLWKWNQTTIELWFIPAGYEIVQHSHPNEQIELYHVYGSCTFYRQHIGQTIWAKMKLFSFLTHFTVPAGWNHWFSVNSTGLVFFNVATWRVGVTPTSASIDFQTTS